MELEEEWRAVVGYEGHYEVSDLGRVRSLKHGRCRVIKPYKTGKDPYKYLSVCLYSPKGRKDAYVHQLVLVSFTGHRPPGKEACHDNGNSFDNRLANLRWDTKRANMQDKKRHGTQTLNPMPGSKNPNATLTEELVADILSELAAGSLQRDLADKYGVSFKTISSIKTRRAWKHVNP